MKKFFAIVLSVLAFAAVASAQPRALGVRATYGGEISYQHSMAQNFLEFDLGMQMHNGFYLTGVYDLCYPVANNTNFYVGPGVSAGVYNYEDESGFNLGVCGQMGIEFQIPQVPLNISLDWRPTFYLNYGNFYASSIALAFRYRF